MTTPSKNTPLISMEGQAVGCDHFNDRSEDLPQLSPMLQLLLVLNGLVEETKSPQLHHLTKLTHIFSLLFGPARFTACRNVKIADIHSTVAAAYRGSPGRNHCARRKALAYSSLVSKPGSLIRWLTPLVPISANLSEAGTLYQNCLDRLRATVDSRVVYGSQTCLLLDVQ